MTDEALFAVPPEEAAKLPQVVERHDGNTYRARKPPEAIAVHLCGYGPGVLVLRCHDLDTADVAASVAALDDPEIERRVVETHELPGVPVWVRYVPDLDEHGHVKSGGGGSWERELRGTAGATPAVLYAAEVTS